MLRREHLIYRAVRLLPGLPSWASAWCAPWAEGRFTISSSFRRALRPIPSAGQGGRTPVHWEKAGNALGSAKPSAGGWRSSWLVSARREIARSAPQAVLDRLIRHAFLAGGAASRPRPGKRGGDAVSCRPIAGRKLAQTAGGGGGGGGGKRYLTRKLAGAPRKNDFSDATRLHDWQRCAFRRQIKDIRRGLVEVQVVAEHQAVFVACGRLQAAQVRGEHRNPWSDQPAQHEIIQDERRRVREVDFRSRRSRRRMRTRVPYRLSGFGENRSSTRHRNPRCA